MRRTKWEASPPARRLGDQGRRALVIALGAALVACSGEAEQAEHAGAVLSESGELRVTTSSEPAERPVRGVNQILLHIESAATGEPVDHLELEMTPFMPSHGHGSSQKPSMAPLGDGLYRFEDVVLSMPGLWELRTKVVSPIVDSFAPRFDVE